ncbi:hypothetical protein ACFLQV_03370 [Calditrichota bacterium]
MEVFQFGGLTSQPIIKISTVRNAANPNRLVRQPLGGMIKFSFFMLESHLLDSSSKIDTVFGKSDN